MSLLDSVLAGVAGVGERAKKRIDEEYQSMRAQTLMQAQSGLRREEATHSINEQLRAGRASVEPSLMQRYGERMIDQEFAGQAEQLPNKVQEVMAFMRPPFNKAPEEAIRTVYPGGDAKAMDAFANILALYGGRPPEGLGADIVRQFEDMDRRLSEARAGRSGGGGTPAQQSGGSGQPQPTQTRQQHEGQWYRLWSDGKWRQDTQQGR